MKKYAWILVVLLLVGLFLYWRFATNYEARGREAAQAMDFERAIELFTKLINKDPSQPEGYYFRSSCYRSWLKFDEALRDAQWLIDHDRPVGYSLRGRVYLAQRRYRDALSDFDKVMAETKPLSTDHLDRANVYLGLWEFEQARKEIDAARRLEPDSDLVYSSLGEISAAMRDHQKALEYDSKAIELTPDDHYYFVVRAFDYSALKKEALAIADLEKAKQLCPRSPWPWRGRTYIHLNNKEYDLALQTANRAIEVAPWWPDAYSARGGVRYYRKEYAPAIADYDECIRLDPTNADAHAARVWPLMKLKEYERAAQSAQKAIDINSRSPVGYDAMAWLLATCPDEKFRHGKKAAEYAAKASTLTFDRDPYYLTTLAAALAEVGDFPAARQWQQKAMDAPGSVPLEDRERNAERLKLYSDGKPYRDQ